eukprot:501244_1
MANCTADNKFEIEECPFISYIIDCLLFFKNNNYEMNENKNKLELNCLTKCYNHMICVHSFCSKQIERQKIKDYTQIKIDKCLLKQKCKTVKEHSMRRREQNKLDKNEKHTHQTITNRNDLLLDMLRSCLVSLHCYLQHDEDTLYRLERDNINNATLRFATNQLQSHDEMDELNEFMAMNADNADFVLYFINWIKLEEYDWESIVYDLHAYTEQEKQSNIYLFLKAHDAQYLFDLIYKQYADINISNTHAPDSNINSINFGISVLQWFKFGDSPNHNSFLEEIVNNKYSTIDQQLLDEYKAKCSVLMTNSSSTQYKYRFNEVLAIKLYTDTDELCASFRRSHWDNNKMLGMKKEFFWWALNLYKAALYHSRPLPRFTSDNVDPMTLYHGINTVLAIKKRIPKYNGPVSTTLVDTVAHRFSNGMGLMWYIKTSYGNPFVFIKGLDVSWISCHKEEAEMLLMDQYLHISQTHDFSDKNTKINHLLKKLSIYGDEIMNKNMFWKQLGFSLNDDKFISLLKQSQLLKYTKYIRKEIKKTILHRLVEELGATAFKHEYEIFLSGKLEYFYHIKLLNKYQTLTSHVHTVDNPLNINNIMNGTKAGEYNNGMVQIYSISPIIIGENGGIYASNIHDGDNIELEYQSSIILVSSSDIIINGVLKSGMNGRIALFAAGNIVINGQIFCGKKGKIFICCNSLENNKYAFERDIKPTMTHKNIDDSKMQYLLKQNNIYVPKFPWNINYNGNIKKSKLSIFKYKGYYNNDDFWSPNHLVDDEDNGYYLSEKGITDGDWIIFHNKTGPIHPTKIQIINSDSSNGSGIRAMSIYLGSTDFEFHNKWYKLCKDITGIDNSHREVQDKDLSLLLSDYFILSHNLNLIKVEILENHGWSNNSFYKFSLFGVEYKW